MITPSELKTLVLDPRKIVKGLDLYIIGQEQAKRTLALTLLTRSLIRLEKDGLIKFTSKINKSNALLMGSTGSGKTSLIRALSKIIKLPITIFDVTSITSSGYIGSKVEDILVQHKNAIYEHVQEHYTSPEMLVSEANYLVKDFAETGIIYLDEIDKIRIREFNGGDINGDMVQNELLKLLDNGNIDLSVAHGNMSGSRNGSCVTDDITFICGGAFSGLAEIIRRRLKKSSGIGFSADLLHATHDTDVFKYVTTKDLIDYGFKPEFLGRLPLKAILTPLSKDMMIRIITEPVDSVFSQYSAMFDVFGIELAIEEDALELLAEEALKLKSGARSLKTIFAKLLEDQLFNIYDMEAEEFIITRDLIKEKKVSE